MHTPSYGDQVRDGFPYVPNKDLRRWPEVASLCAVVTVVIIVIVITIMTRTIMTIILTRLGTL